MLETPLADAQTALDSIRTNGDPFATTPLVPQPLGGVTFLHPRDGMQAVAADARVLTTTGCTYANSKPLRHAIMAVGGKMNTLQNVAHLIEGAYRQPRIVWGVSGFASLGFPCDTTALEKLYEYLAISYNQPSLMCDGAVGAGILGANGILAARHGIKTVGVTPLEGLPTMAPRSSMIVYGNTYDDRLIIVGLLPDILAVDGGGTGAQSEVLATLSGGGSVLMLREPDESIVPWWNVPLIAQARSDGQLVVCPSINDIPEYAERLVAATRLKMELPRPHRLDLIRSLFNADTGGNAP